MCGIQHGPVHHQAQGRGLSGLRAEAEHGQLRLRQDAGGHLKDEGHDDIGGDVGQDVRQDDAHHGVAAQLGEVDVVTVAEGDDLGAHRTAGPGPARKADDHRDERGAAKLLADGVGDQDQEDEGGDDGEDVRDEHDDIIHSAAQITGQQAERQTDQRRHAAGDEAHAKRHGRGGDQLPEGVAAKVVRAEGQGLDVGHLFGVDIVGVVDGALLNVLSGLGVLLHHQQRVGGVGVHDGVVQTAEVHAVGIGHALDFDVLVVRFPGGQQSVRFAGVDAADVVAVAGHPVDHFGAGIAAEQGVDAVLLSFGEAEGLRLGAGGVIHRNICAGPGKGADADTLQRVAGVEQRIENHHQQQRHKNNEADDKTRGVENIF